MDLQCGRSGPAHTSLIEAGFIVASRSPIVSDSDRIEELLGGTDTGTDDLIPTVDVPDVDEPEATLADSDVDPAVIALFWRLVLVSNVALFGLSVGPMVLYFRGDALLGGGLLGVGLLAAGYGSVRYWQFQRERTDDGPGPDD